jgi:hypothetical protein
MKRVGKFAVARARLETWLVDAGVLRIPTP